MLRVRCRKQIVLVLGLTLTSSLAVGQPPTADDRQAAAERRAAVGMEHVNKGRYAEAIPEFRAAHQLFPDPKYLHNAGRAAHLANKLTDALRFYRRYLAEAGANARRERIDAWIRECELALEAAYAELTVNTTPPGARVFVDGEAKSHRSPLTIRLAPGKHSLQLEADGYQTVNRTVELKPGGTLAIDLSLSKQIATVLEVASSVPGATVYLDGRNVGRTPLRLPDVRAGTFRLRVEAPGHVAYEQAITLVAARTTTVRAALAAEAARTEPAVTRGSVVWRSALFSGLGQLHADRSTSGALFLTGEAVAVAGVVAGLVGRSIYLGNRDQEKDTGRWHAWDERATTMNWLAIGSGIGGGLVWVASLIHAGVMDLQVPVTPTPGPGAGAGLLMRF